MLAVDDAAETGRILGAVHLAAGLLIAGLALPLIAGRVPRNRWYGVRIRKSLASDESWYAINRVGGRWLLASGAAIAALGALVLLVPPESEAVAIAVGFAPAAIVLLGVVPVLGFARRL